MNAEKDDRIALQTTGVAGRPAATDDTTRAATGDVRRGANDDRTRGSFDESTDRQRPDEPAGSSRASDGSTPAVIARRLCEGFVHHDERERDAAIEAFAAVDSFQFAHLDGTTTRRAAAAYVDALWAKDAVEDRCRIDGGIDPDELAAADWSAVGTALAERAALVGIDPEYATLTVDGWRRHKVGGDYWTPHLRAQQLELRAALRDPSYPDKRRHGRSGIGPEATRYLLGVELHDCRRWEEAHAVMVPYFEAIRRGRTARANDAQGRE